MLKSDAYKSYVNPAILYGSEDWRLKKRDGKFAKGREANGASNVCGVQLKHRHRVNDLMLMSCLNETIDQLAMANNVRWYGHVLNKENGHAEMGINP